MEKEQITKYDPKKTYSWSDDDEFIFSGKEFGSAYNKIAQFIQTPVSVMTPVKYQSVVDAFTVLQRKLESMVNADIIKEKEPLPQE